MKGDWRYSCAPLNPGAGQQTSNQTSPGPDLLPSPGNNTDAHCHSSEPVWKGSGEE